MKIIDPTTSFTKLTTSIIRGTLIKTSTFHYYEINDNINQKLINNQPEIIIHQDGRKYKIQIQGIEKLLACNKIQETIETKIDGNFKDWEGNTTFNYSNQQEWKKTVQLPAFLRICINPPPSFI